MTRQILMNKFGSLVGGDLVADAAVRHPRGPKQCVNDTYGTREGLEKKEVRKTTTTHRLCRLKDIQQI